jgi:hypothetical protein
MSSYRYDKLDFTSSQPNFINLPTLTLSLPCSGTIANGGNQTFSVPGQVESSATFFDFKAINTNTRSATYLTNAVAIDPIWLFVSSEVVQNKVTIANGLVTVGISVSNFTGGPITLIPQTFSIEVIKYQLPL